MERSRRLGDVWLGLTLRQALGLDTVCAEIFPPGREKVPWSLMAAIEVIARLCEPASELYLRGELLRGPQRLASEWKHHAIDPRGPACCCGRHGCVETMISGPALVRQFRAAGEPDPAASDVAAPHLSPAPVGHSPMRKGLDNPAR